MSRRLVVAGSLWSVPTTLQDSLLRLRHAAGLHRLHWDFSDGTLGAPGGFTPLQAEQVSESLGFAHEAHLITQDPRTLLDGWTDLCDRLAIHIESPHWQEAAARIEQRGCTPVVAVSPETDLTLLPAELDVLCMSIIPGQAGSTFQPQVLERVAALRAATPNRKIGVDGGITRSHLAGLATAGTDWVVVGTDLFLSETAQTDWQEVLANQT